MSFYENDFIMSIINNNFIMLLFIMSVILHVPISIKICRGVSYLYMLCKQYSKEEKIYIYPFNLISDTKDVFFSKWIFILFSALILLRFYPENFFSDYLKLFIAIYFAAGTFHFTTHPDKKQILKINHLQIGHGAALAYYKNYLEMTLTERFSERIDKFSSKNKVKILKKLFILVPQTCRVYTNLDEIQQEDIERCFELPEEEINHSGIKKRKYNITIYNINGIRMAIEFAQPLKAFYLLKRNDIFTEDEMLYERKIFISTLKTFLKEDPHKYFEIVDYDDSTESISKVLTEKYCAPVGYDSEIV